MKHRDVAGVTHVYGISEFFFFKDPVYGGYGSKEISKYPKFQIKSKLAKLVNEKILVLFFVQKIKKSTVLSILF